MSGMLPRALLLLVLLVFFSPFQSFSQLVPQWLVTGKGQFTNPKTVIGIAGCEGGYYLTGGLDENDFVLQVSNNAGLDWSATLTLKRYGYGEIQPPLTRPFAEVVVNTVSRPTPAACFAYGWGSYVFEASRFPFLLRSLDSGRTWTEVELADSARGVSDACIAMRDAMHGIRCGGYIDAQHSVLYRTSDGGDSWSTVDIPFVDYRTEWLSYANDGTLFATEWRTERPLYRSTDNGDTWEHRGLLPNPRTPSFVSANLGWQAFGIATGLGDAERDVIMRTTDGGSTWEYQLDALQDPPFGLTAIGAADERHVIAVGREGKLLHSVDGGQSWERAMRPFFLYEPACAEVIYPDTASAVTGGLFHIATYTGKRTLLPPVVTCTQGVSTLQRTAQWAPVDGATHYQLELAKDYPSSSILFEIFDTNPYKQSAWQTQTSLALDPWLQINMDYFVRVRARGGEYTSDWSWPVKFYIADPTGIEATVAAESITMSLHPQPTRGVTVLHAQGFAANASWRLRAHDVLGRLLFSIDGRSGAQGEINQQIVLDQVASGLVFVHVRCGSEQRMLPLRVLR